jgi:hypothetical protein
VSLRDQLSGNSRRLVVAVAAPVAWVGLSALFGDLHLLDWVVAAVLFVSFGYSASRKPPDDDPKRGIYGPPE